MIPFQSHQNLMSVLWIPVHVMKTPCAPTAMVLTAVLVNKDLLEMVQSVKVLENLFKSLLFKYEEQAAVVCKILSYICQLLLYRAKQKITGRSKRRSISYTSSRSSHGPTGLRVWSETRYVLQETIDSSGTGTVWFTTVQPAPHKKWSESCEIII